MTTIADYILRGTRSLISYAVTQGVNLNTQRERMAAAIGVPVQKLAGSGLDPGTYISPKYNEAQAEALAVIMGVAVADNTTNGGQEIVG